MSHEPPIENPNAVRTPPKSASLTRFAWLSIAAALLTISLKTTAWLITGSVGLLSDAAESVVNLVAAIFSLLMLNFAARPADEGHPFGHGKAEYFASGFEGLMILIAAAAIGWTAVDRLLHPQPLAELDIGLWLSALSTLINLVVARILLTAGRKYGSITLEADGQHLMTDVWTTVAIVAGLVGYLLIGVAEIDPAIAILAALHICWTGLSLIGRSVEGLLDRGMPEDELARIESVFHDYRTQGVDFHDLRTRQAGSHRLITVHVLVPGEYTVQQGHDVVERIEAEIRVLFHSVTIITHLEPIEDSASFAHDRIDIRPVPARVLSRPEHAQAPPHHPPWITVTGLLMLVGSGAGSMFTQGVWMDFTLGGSILGLILILLDRKLRNVREKSALPP
ncbi:MAG: cation diffusion facilitator family transporter [Methylococcaceae bacterium]